MKSKEEDCYEIQKLNEEIRELRSNKELASINELMRRPTQKNFYSNSTEDKLKELMDVIEGKDTELRKLQNKYDELHISK